MGRSNAEPSLRISAGAKLIVTACCEGKSKPQFRSADLIRSRLSFTAMSGNPTTLKLPCHEESTVRLHFHEIGVNSKDSGTESLEEHP